MKTSVLLLALLTGAVGSTRLMADDCCETPAVTTAAVSEKNSEAAPTRHPLKGVVMDVLPEKSALLVKHEEIPGVMHAMTMLFNVDADTLKSASIHKGTAITGLLVRKSDGWWLEQVAISK
jgi:Cu/Ag efflux protein CusF